jgi:Fe2+ or Zn2+ uptake regulation protein
MDAKVINRRQTKYCKSIEHILSSLGHATNAEMLAILRERYPDVSATTVHRATARLAERHIIGTAPTTLDGSMRYDANIMPHDHFQCTRCDILRDIDIKDSIVTVIEGSLNGCRISGRLTIRGICSKCISTSSNHDSAKL